MKLNRALIKSQAKSIIKGQVFGLFLISIVVGLLAGGTTFSNSIDSFDDLYKSFSFSDNSSYFDRFTDDEGKPNLDYFKNFTGSVTPVSAKPLNKFPTLLGFSSDITAIIGLVFTPLTITLCGLYVMLIRGNKMKTGEYFSFVFKNTFNSTFLKKFLLAFVEELILIVMFCLFIIPGIIFYYRYYFAKTIMADNPNIGVKEALKLSTEMTRGHKGELFVLDLSYLGWALLFPLTAGLISIYTVPYYNTTKALYYENFRIRTLQEGNPYFTIYMGEQPSEQAVAEEPQIIVEEAPADTFGSGMDTDYYNGNF